MKGFHPSIYGLYPLKMMVVGSHGKAIYRSPITSFITGDKAHLVGLASTGKWHRVTSDTMKPKAIGVNEYSP